MIFPFCLFCNRFTDPNVNSKRSLFVLVPSVCEVKEQEGVEEGVQCLLLVVSHMALLVSSVMKTTPLNGKEEEWIKRDELMSSVLVIDSGW